MVIGVVLHAGQRARFAEAARTLTGIIVGWAVYEREDQIRERVAELLHADRLDGLLLGPVPYARARDLIPEDLPVTVIRPAALELALAWAQARGNGWPATPVSIDTFEQETVDEVAAALDLDPGAIATLPFRREQLLAEIVDFHRDRLAATDGRYVISVRTGVAAALDGRTAVLSAVTTPATIRAGLYELALRIRHREADARRFAAAVFRPVHPPGHPLVQSQPGVSDPDLGARLRETAELGDAWIDDRGADGIIVFAPAATFEAFTRRWTALPELDEDVAAGFGIGTSARSCVTLAEQAADRAAQEAGSCAFLITEDGVMIGPMGTAAAPLTYTYREHGGLEVLAGRAGLSAATLARLVAIERSLGGRPVSSGEVAHTLGITDPSGRRLIRKLSESQLAVEDGSTQPHRKGRPARLYRLAITDALGATR